MTRGAHHPTAGLYTCGSRSPGAKLNGHPPSPRPSLLLGLSLPGTPAWVQEGQSSRKWDLLHRPWRLTSPPLPLPYRVTKERWAGRSQPLPQPNPAAPEVALGTGQTPSHPGHQAQGLSARPLLLKLPQSPSANSLDPTAQLNFEVRTQAPLKLTLRTEVDR